MSQEYLKECARELDARLKQLPGRLREVALEGYRNGLRLSFGSNYPQKFPEDASGDSIRGHLFAELQFAEYSDFYQLGKYVGQQFGVLEVESARETLFTQIRKREVQARGEGFPWNILRFLRRIK